MKDLPTGKEDYTKDNFSGGLVSYPLKNPISPQDLGSATIEPKGEFEAGSYQTFKWVYTAGKFGIDDSGSIRICFRFASDQGKPQFEDPQGTKLHNNKSIK